MSAENITPMPTQPRHDLGAAGEPWGKMDNESNLWYARFHEYLMLGPKRSVLEVMRITGAAPASAQSWYQEAKRWRWRDRAEAWDELQRKIDREHIEHARENSRKMRIDLLERIQQRFEAAIPMLDEAELDWKSTPALLRAIVQELRVEYEPKQHDAIGIEVSVPQDAQEALRVKLLTIKQRLSSESESE